MRKRKTSVSLDRDARPRYKKNNQTRVNNEDGC